MNFFRKKETPELEYVNHTDHYLSSLNNNENNQSEENKCRG